jgi:SIR2-like domain
VITTNYDDLIERTLTAAREPFDVVWYEAKRGPLHGRFLHRSPGGEVVPIVVPNEYTALELAERPVILKLHGAIDRVDAKRDSYVITEDSYIDYLVGADVGEQIPFSLVARMEESHFLFLGYSMRDWNMRVILKRLWGGEQLGRTSWAVQLEPTGDGARDVEKKLWSRRGDVDLLYAPLREYVERLGAELDAAPAP